MKKFNYINLLKNLLESLQFAIFITFGLLGTMFGLILIFSGVIIVGLILFTPGICMFLKACEMNNKLNNNRHITKLEKVLANLVKAQQYRTRASSAEGEQ